jgi:hypothetical protein
MEKLKVWLLYRVDKKGLTRLGCLAAAGILHEYDKRPGVTVLKAAHRVG